MQFTDYTIETNTNTVFLNFSTRCPSNRQYTVTINPGISGTLPNGEIETLQSEYQFWFTSLYCPLYSTIGRVKLQTGPIGDAFTDDSIYRMIHKNSLEAIDLLNVSSPDPDIAYDYYGCDWQDAPFYIRRYVECKTAYDLLAVSKLASTTNGTGGSQMKSLGDMSIKYGAAASQSANDPDKSRELYSCWNEALRMFRNIRVAVKGYYDGSKGFNHPTREYHHNRVIRPVSFNNSRPNGPWVNSYPRWNGYKWI